MSHTRPEHQSINTDSQKITKPLLIILTIAVIAACIVPIFYFSNFHAGLSSSNTDWGTFGDFVGGTLNPILSFLSLIALMLTIVLQSRELEATRKELERTASAQEKTEKVLTEQTNAQIRQQFEGTFFSLLEQHNKALDKISIATGKYADNKSELDNLCILIFRNTELSAAKNQLEDYNETFGHYFRILYQTLKFLATNYPGSKINTDFTPHNIEHIPVSPEEKMYSNIIRSFLSHKITQILTIICHCKDEQDIYWKYKLLLERYSMLEHMPFKIDGGENTLLIQSIPHYSKKAFGNNTYLEKRNKN